MTLEKMRHIGVELKGHAPFTVAGALAGIFFMLIFRDMSKPHASTLFSIFHPGHVVLSAMVTASMFGIHRRGRNFLLILVIGYAGSIGIATLQSDIIPELSPENGSAQKAKDQLLRKADTCMYAAKELGRNRTVPYWELARRLAAGIE